MSKTFKISIEVICTKDKELPDWGLGPGILAEQEAIIEDEYLDSPFLYVSLYEHGKALMDDVVKINITENE